MPVITMDGPAVSGKSSIARLVARELAYTFVGTGNMYRAMTWAVIDAGLDPTDADAVAAEAGWIWNGAPDPEGALTCQEPPPTFEASLSDTLSPSSW